MNADRLRECGPYLRHAASRGAFMGALGRFLRAASGRRRASREVPPYLRDLGRPSGPASVPVEPRLCLGLARTLRDGGAAPSKVSAPLATRSVDLDIPPGVFRASFPDEEDVFALHRFGWVHPVLAADPTRACAGFVWGLVRAWIDMFPADPVHPSWEPYSVSERVVNWIHLRHAAAGPRDGAFLASLRAHGESLFGSLEYYGDRRTNNHLINNGRALYILGAFLSDEVFREAGRRVLREEAGRSFTPGGFLREGSSHYHFLMLRTYREAARAAASMEDAPFLRWLKPFIGRLEEAARFFLPEGASAFPLFGDVSPDVPPSWLLGLVQPARPEGWHALWSEPDRPLSASGGAETGFIDRRGDGWCRFDAPGYRVFWRVPPEGGVPGHFHGHHDAGGFEMHADGEPVFVDRGRSSYVRGAEGRYGKSVAAHNATRLDGYEPFVSNGLNGGDYLLDSYGTARAESRLSGATLSLEHDGYARLAGVGACRRSFDLSGTGMLIEDSVAGAGTRRLETFFHAAPGVDVVRAGDVWTFHRPGRPAETRLSFEGVPAAAEVIPGRHSSRYGETVPAPTLRFRQTVRLPVVNRFRIEVR